MATIYHHRTGRYTDPELAFETEVDEPVPIDREEYVKIAEDDDTTVSNAFERWNAGSRKEADLFKRMQYCVGCSEIFTDGDGGHELKPDNPPEILERDLSPNARKHKEETSHMIVNGPRSLSVGDVVEENGTPYIVLGIGWGEAEWT